MMNTILTGLIIGLATAVVSESVLHFGKPLIGKEFFKVFLIGAALRAVWVLFALFWCLTQTQADARLFVPALLCGYLAAQVFEGCRYKRALEY